jgi:hypothetical protein
MQKKKIRIPSKKFSKRANTDVQKRLEELHAQIRTELAGQTLLTAAEIIHQGREERDNQLQATLR